MRCRARCSDGTSERAHPDRARAEPRAPRAAAAACSAQARRARGDREALRAPGTVAAIAVHRVVDTARRLPQRATETHARPARCRQSNTLPDHAPHDERAGLSLLRGHRPPRSAGDDAARDCGAVGETFATRARRGDEGTGYARAGRGADGRRAWGALALAHAHVDASRAHAARWHLEPLRAGAAPRHGGGSRGRAADARRRRRAVGTAIPELVRPCDAAGSPAVRGRPRPRRPRGTRTRRAASLPRRARTPAARRPRRAATRRRHSRAGPLSPEMGFLAARLCAGRTDPNPAREVPQRGDREKRRCGADGPRRRLRRGDLEREANTAHDRAVAEAHARRAGCDRRRRRTPRRVRQRVVRASACPGGGLVSPVSSVARIPGRNSAESVTAAPTSAAPTNVARTPIAAATGAVSANDSGRSPIEISQSRLETRPSIDVGTCRCFIVAHRIVPAASRPLKTKHAAINCQAAVASPYPATESVASVHVTYITVTSRRGWSRRPIQTAAPTAPTPPAASTTPNVRADACRSFLTTNGSRTSVGPRKSRYATAADASVPHSHTRPRNKRNTSFSPAARDACAPRL